MVVVLRAHGMRVVIFTDDHEPAHVHVFGDGQAKIDLGEGGRPSLVWARRMTRGDVRRAMEIVADNREALLMRWRAIHG